MIVFLKEFFKKADFEKKSADDKKHAKFPVGKELLYLANLEFCCLLAGRWSLKIVWTQIRFDRTSDLI